jgi:hypothetical protein
MAKFHEKVLCLFHKDYKQLKKEADRRGLNYDGKEKTIAQIIWKDAYDAGVVEGREKAALGGTIRNCPANCCGNAKPEVKEYCLCDIINSMKYRLELTEEQVRVIKWLISQDFMTDIELSEWDDAFEDVGRI